MNKPQVGHRGGPQRLQEKDGGKKGGGEGEGDGGIQKRAFKNPRTMVVAPFYVSRQRE